MVCFARNRARDGVMGALGVESPDMSKQRFKAVPFPQFAARIMNEYQTIKAPKTADAMRRITEHVAALKVKTTAGLDRELVMNFIKKRKADGRATNTIIGELGRLKALCNFAVRAKVLEECPFVRGEVLLRPEKSKKLSHLAKRQLADLAAMLEAEIEQAIAKDATNSWRKRVSNNFYLGNEWRARRLHASVLTWVLTGARKCEVLFCWKEDLDFAAQIFHIKSERRRLKTIGSERLVPMVDQLRDVLNAWLPYSGPSPYLFAGARMKAPWFHGAPGYKPLDQVKKACERAGITGGHIHLFRHTWLTHAEGWGIPQQAAQKITGITQEKTLEYYVHRQAEELHSFVRGVRIEELTAAQTLLRPSAN